MNDSNSKTFDRQLSFKTENDTNLSGARLTLALLTFSSARGVDIQYGSVRGIQMPHSVFTTLDKKQTKNV